MVVLSCSLCTGARRALGALAVTTLALAAPAIAQGSFQTLDPFYAGESARHAFFDGFAVSGEVGFRDRDLLGIADQGAPASNLALAARIDYAIMPQVDVSAVADLSGAARTGPLGLSWIIVKPYWRNGSSDYAVRVAVDPASEGGLGFRQTDVAFLSATSLSADVTSDFAIGVRRVQTGYVEESDDPTEFSVLGDDRVRLHGSEIRGSMGYNVLFDPAGSRFSFSALAELGDYSLIRAGDAESGTESTSEPIRSGIGWLRGGVEFNRPSFQFAPYVSVPMVTVASVEGEDVRHGPRPDKARFGLRITLR